MGEHIQDQEWGFAGDGTGQEEVRGVLLRGRKSVISPQIEGHFGNGLAVPRGDRS